MFPIADKVQRIKDTFDFMLDKITIITEHNDKDINFGKFIHDGKEYYFSMRGSKDNARLELYNHNEDTSNAVMCAGLAVYNIRPSGIDNNYVEFGTKVNEYQQLVVQPRSDKRYVRELYTEHEYGEFSEESWFQLSTEKDILDYDAVKYIVDSCTALPWDAYSFWYNPNKDYMFFEQFMAYFEERKSKWQEEIQNS